MIALLLAIAVGCADSSSPERVPSDLQPFFGAASSLENLGRRTLEALERRDTSAVNALRLSAREHNDVLWPELPASAPHLNVPVDFVWENLVIRHRSSLLRQMGWFEARGVTHEGTYCRGAIHEFDSFRVLTDCWISFRTGAGERFEVQAFEDVVERGGGFKFFRIYEDPPRAGRPGAKRPSS